MKKEVNYNENLREKKICIIFAPQFSDNIPHRGQRYIAGWSSW